MTLDRQHCYAYARPALTVDLVILYPAEPFTHVLLIKRKHPPFAGQWALPGGFVDEGETLKQAALRELKEETLLSNVDVVQVGAFGTPGRDPRGWTVSIAFSAVVSQKMHPKAQDDAAEAMWMPITQLPDLAFDHLEIIRAALQRQSSLPQIASLQAR